jgi:hypothetical protein
MNRGFAAGLIAAGPLWGFLVWIGSSNLRQRDLGVALLVVLIFVLVVVGLLEVVGRQDSKPARAAVGYLQVALGADGRFSTGKAVAALWTLILSSALVFLSVMSWRADGTGADDWFAGDWNSYLLLLGGPFAAAVAAKGITVARLDDNADVKSNAVAASDAAMTTTSSVTEPPKATDVITKDTGETDFVDTQYTLFTLVAVIYFTGALINNMLTYARLPIATSTTGAVSAEAGIAIGLPSIPAALLGLTSLAALTYVGNKTVQTQGLRVVRLDPNPVAPSAIVTVTLVNLAATATIANTKVLVVDSSDVTLTLGVSGVTPASATVAFNAPASAGQYNVSVVTVDSTAGPLPLTVA